jgi:hypothetical protein
MRIEFNEIGRFGFRMLTVLKNSSFREQTKQTPLQHAVSDHVKSDALNHLKTRIFFRFSNGYGSYLTLFFGTSGNQSGFEMPFVNQTQLL